MRRLLTALLLAAAISVSAAFAFPGSTTARQPPAPGAVPDTARLRQALAAAFGDNLQIVRTELSTGLYERSGTFWLVHARPLRSGDYELKYRYDYHDAYRPNDPHYTHVEHTSYVRVGERGCWRRREGKDVCLGDTILLPFVVDEHTGHTFVLTPRGGSGGAALAAWEPPADAEARTDDVPNPVSAHLRYLGSETLVMPHRKPGSTTVVSAEFEAVAPGAFNLSLYSRPQDGPPVSLSAFSTVPIVVVARGQPVTVLLANETVVGTDEKREFSSHSGNQYLTTALLLQPGDRISLEYLRYTSDRDDRPRPALGEVAPVIERFPFRLNTGERFNAWIADHLPVANPQSTR